jgi:hypothetical protein
MGLSMKDVEAQEDWAEYQGEEAHTPDSDESEAEA